MNIQMFHARKSFSLRLKRRTLAYFCHSGAEKKFNSVDTWPSFISVVKKSLFKFNDDVFFHFVTDGQISFGARPFQQLAVSSNGTR